MVLGHLKAGVTPAQAIADLNSIGSYLEKTYPKDDSQHDLFRWRVQVLSATCLGRPVRAIHDGIDAAGRD